MQPWILKPTLISTAWKGVVQNLSDIYCRLVLLYRAILNNVQKQLPYISSGPVNFALLGMMLLQLVRNFNAAAAGGYLVTHTLHVCDRKLW